MELLHLETLSIIRPVTRHIVPAAINPRGPAASNIGPSKKQLFSPARIY